MDGRTFPAVEHAALKKTFVSRAAHFSTERINLTDKVPLRRPANRRVAGAVSNGIQINGKDKRAAAEPGRCQSGFDSRMSRADYRNVIGSRIICQNIPSSITPFKISKLF